MSERDIEKNPYSPDEERVAKFFFEKGAGGGDDPIGFIMASYDYLVAERNELRKVREATSEMLLMGARSIANTIRTDNHTVRAKACWEAMWSARDGVVEPVPQGRAEDHDDDAF